MAIGMAVALRNARLDAITTRAGANAKLRIYDGTMPKEIGRIGRPGPLGVPGDRFLRGHPFRSPKLSDYAASVSGVTRDSAGAALGNCVVQLFQTTTDAFVAETTSDGTGNYTLRPTVSGPFYLVAYKAGGPDVAGTSVNTVVAT